MRADGNSCLIASKNSRSTSFNLARIRIRSMSLLTLPPSAMTRLWPAGSLSGYSVRLCPCSCLKPRRSTDSGLILPAICVSPEFRSVVNPTPRDAVGEVAQHVASGIMRVRRDQPELDSREGSPLNTVGLLNFESTKFTRAPQLTFDAHCKTDTERSRRLEIPPELRHLRNAHSGTWLHSADRRRPTMRTSTP